MQHMYIDECKGSNASFYLLVHIYGEEDAFNDLSGEIDSINKANTDLTGNTFTGIHAVKINDDKISTRGRLVELWLDVLEKYIRDERLNCFITVQSKGKKKVNSEWYASEVLKFFDSDELKKQKSDIANVSEQERRDIAACINQVWFLGARADKIVGNDFVVHPDQIGKILEEIEDNANNEYQIFPGIIRNFKETTALILNAALRRVRTFFKQTKEVKIAQFEPLDDVCSFPVQLCDIMGNYIYHSVLAQMREHKPISEYKHGVLSTRFDLRQSLDDLSKNFCLNDKGELLCTNDTYVMCIDIKSYEVEEAKS